MRELKPPKWVVYGWVFGHPTSQSRLSSTFSNEEAAWKHITLLRLESTKLDAVLVRIDWRWSRDGKQQRPVHTVLVRYGAGRGWFE
jgi:hypothetical protein